MEGEKVPVSVVGWQYDLEDNPVFLLVNEPSGTTVKYNAQKHTIISVKDLEVAV